MNITRAAIQACRDDVAAQVRAYRDLVGAASKASGMSLVRIDLGERVALNADDVESLCAAFLAELEGRASS